MWFEMIVFMLFDSRVGIKDPKSIQFHKIGMKQSITLEEVCFDYFLLILSMMDEFT